ncbi:MAG: orotidine-5'-phosphate decarboxylase [bacterium]|nr:orotidine-5'-phosphate decarboxylase [bacterium]
MTRAPETPRQRIIFPLDVPSLAEARPWVERLSGHVGLFKVGLELYSAAGPDAVRMIQEHGDTGVFLDLKLHDIPATVAGAASVIRGLGVQMLTVHASGGKAALEAAVQAAGSDTCILAVTRLTSQSATPDEVTELARVAREASCGGIVCAGTEAAAVRQAVGPALRIVTPGIRPAGADVGDQVRVVTPAAAIAAGADYIVVGRPIRNAPDPIEAARAIETELAAR